MSPKLRQRGFSMLEMAIVLAIIMIATAIAIPSITTVLKAQKADSALQLVLMQVRTARQLAINRRVMYTVQFVNPGTVLTTEGSCGTDPTKAVKIEIPKGIKYSAESGIPVDGIGTGKDPIQMAYLGNGATDTVCFYPDGSARDTTGALNNGAVYISYSPSVETAVGTRLSSSRAVSIFGATGRIAGWQLHQATPGNWQWRQK